MNEEETSKKRKFIEEKVPIDHKETTTSKKLRLSEESFKVNEPIAVNTEDRQEAAIKNERSITLDMSKYSPEIRRLTDSELVQIFNIGVAVKLSFTLTVSESSDFVKKELESQMQPIARQMTDMQTQVKQDVTQIEMKLNQGVSKHMIKFSDDATALKSEITTMKNDLIGQIGGMKNDLVDNVGGLKNNLVEKVNVVSDKVMPICELEKRVTEAIKSSENSLLKQLDEYKKEVNQMAMQRQKPAIKGSVGETLAISILKERIPYFTFNDVSKQNGKGDIQVVTTDGHYLLVEVKTYSDSVPKREIEKFKRDVASAHDVKVGLMFSVNSGIAMKSKQRKFQVDAVGEKFLIYVPNALQQEDVMVWSVLLANELAEMNVALKDGQAERLQKLCEKFKEEVNDARKCQEKMKLLKEALQDLETEMEPMLKVIENARREINNIMNTK